MALTAPSLEPSGPLLRLLRLPGSPHVSTGWGQGKGFPGPGRSPEVHASKVRISCSLCTQVSSGSAGPQSGPRSPPDTAAGAASYGFCPFPHSREENNKPNQPNLCIPSFLSAFLIQIPAFLISPHPHSKFEYKSPKIILKIFKAVDPRHHPFGPPMKQLGCDPVPQPTSGVALLCLGAVTAPASS